VGNVTNGIPLVITDSLPSGFSYVAFISASLNGTNYVATNSFISVSTSNLAEPVFTINRAILPNQSCLITFDAKVASTNALGTYYNQAEMTYGSVSLPPTPLAPVTVQSNPVLSWSSISPLVYGVAITTNNALYPTSNVPGSFAFAPTNGAILPVGTNSLVANFTPSNTTSYASGTITNTVVITKAILTTTCQPTNKVYGQTNPPLSYLLTGFVNGENSNSLTTQPVASTTVILSTPVGVYTNAITASGGTASNYSFTYVPANFTVTKAVSTVAMSGTTSFTYGGSAQGPDSNTKTGSTGGVTYSYSGAGGTLYGPSATKPTLVGSYTATATLAADSNYEGATSSASGFSIVKDGSTISVTGFTSFTYSGVSQGPGTISKTGSSGAVTYSYSGAGGTSYVASATKPTEVGSYEVTASLEPDSNYDGATSTAYGFRILAKPITITADPKSKISGESDPTLTSQFTVGSIEPRDALSGSLNRVEGETPGKYAITSTLSNGNYAITFVSADLTILDGVNPTANEDRLVPVPIKTSKFHVLEVLANDTDLLKRSLTVTAVSALSELGGTVELRGGWILYTPPAGLVSGVEDSFTYTLSNGVGSAQGTVYLLAVEWAMTDAMNILSVTDSASGKDVTFSAIPNFVYEVFATSSIAPANWSKLGDYTADAQGILRVNDVAAGSSRFYRMRSQP
jgi:hypothetical protein